MSRRAGKIRPSHGKLPRPSWLLKFEDRFVIADSLQPLAQTRTSLEIPLSSIAASHSLPMRPRQAERRAPDYLRHGHHQPGRRARLQGGHRVRAVSSQPWRTGVPPVPGDDPTTKCPTRAPFDHRQLYHPQNPGHLALAAASCALPTPLRPPPRSSIWWDAGFAGLTEEQLRRGVHCSTRELQDAIRHYLDLNNRHPKPFTWIKTADEILESDA
jgi:hypothetical protein